MSCECCQKLHLKSPSGRVIIHQGDIVTLGRFNVIRWEVKFGWYSFGGNRAICGWYLRDVKPPHTVKPIQKTDLDDIYILQR